MRLNQQRETLQPNRASASTFSGTSASSVQNVGRFVNSIIKSYQAKLAPLNISVEIDFDEFEATINPALVRIVTTGLMDNAAKSLGAGGEISVTLIDGKHQWELEVADSLGMIFSSIELPAPDHTVGQPSNNLPVIIPFPQTESLRDAHRAATAHQGQIQTWSCPQGGTAHVFVVSRRPYQSATFQTKRLDITRPKPT